MLVILCGIRFSFKSLHAAWWSAWTCSDELAPHIYLCLFVLKFESPEEDHQFTKRQKTMGDVLNEGKNNSSYLPTLGHVVAICHARIPFIQLREEVRVQLIMTTSWNFE